jgi:hypothetical protein
MSEAKPLPVFNNRHLRFVFVAFLFSAAIADVGRASVKVFTHFPFFLPAATHLAVAFVAISTSWVYWARNIGDGPQLKDIFSREYLLLVLDLLLVILYIGVAETVELPGRPMPKPSAVPESLLLALAYFVYFVWDLVHDVWSRRANLSPLSVDPGDDGEGAVELPEAMERATLGQTVKAAAIRSAASLFCCLLALVVVTVARFYGVSSNAGVCLLNLAELGNLVLFRSLKAVEYQFDASLHPAYREGRDRYADVRGRMRVSGALAALVYVGALLASRAV